MALIDCPKCGKKISDKAVVCPGCGIEFSKKGVVIEKETKKENVETKNPTKISSGKKIVMAISVVSIIFILAAALTPVGIKAYNRSLQSKQEMFEIAFCSAIQTALTYEDAYDCMSELAEGGRGTLTVEEIYNMSNAFSDKVKEAYGEDPLMTVICGSRKGEPISFIINPYDNKVMVKGLAETDNECSYYYVEDKSEKTKDEIMEEHGWHKNYDGNGYYNDDGYNVYNTPDGATEFTDGYGNWGRDYDGDGEIDEYGTDN